MADLPHRSSRFTDFTWVWPSFFCRWLIIALFFSSWQSDACPIFLNKSDVPKIAGSREKVYLFALEPGGQWQNLHLQIDALDQLGNLVFDAKERKPDVEPSDRLVFAAQGFGGTKPEGKNFPCRASTGYKIIDYTDQNKVAYLLSCPDGLSEPVNHSNEDPAPKYISDRRVIYDDKYTYVLSGANQMLFDQIALGTGPGRYVAAFDARMQIRASLRSLFSATFDSEDIQSKVVSSQEGPVGLNARLSFYLNMLMFKISLALTTDVSFFADSAYVPMVLQLPVDANRYLDPRSGIFYHWALGKEILASPVTLNLPIFNQASLDKLSASPVDTNAVVKEYCPNRRWCYFSFKLGGEKVLDMNFRISRDLVSKGFYPMYVDNMNDFEKIAGWTPSKSELRRGFFFSTVALSAGAYAWEFWLRLTEKGSNFCPHPVIVRPL